MGIEGLIDLARHPIAEPARPETVALIDRCRAALAERGAYVLQGFLRRDAVATILDELSGVLGLAYYQPKTHNPFLAPPDEKFPPSHPRNREQHTDSATLAYDLIGRKGLLEAIYRWAPLRTFVARTLGYEALHPYADPLAAVNVLVYPPGAQTGWHFDNAHFVVTLMLQPAQSGGRYEYAPFIRAPGDENYPAIEAVLDGDARTVRALEQRVGDLVVFQGRYTLHRVTAVEGDVARLVAVFSYDVEPGTTLTAHTRRTFYGRDGMGGHEDAAEKRPG